MRNFLERIFIKFRTRPWWASECNKYMINGCANPKEHLLP